MCRYASIRLYYLLDAVACRAGHGGNVGHADVLLCGGLYALSHDGGFGNGGLHCGQYDVEHDGVALYAAQESAARGVAYLRVQEEYAVAAFAEEGVFPFEVGGGDDARALNADARQLHGVALLVAYGAEYLYALRPARGCAQHEKHEEKYVAEISHSHSYKRTGSRFIVTLTVNQ